MRNDIVDRDIGAWMNDVSFKFFGNIDFFANNPRHGCRDRYFYHGLIHAIHVSEVLTGYVNGSIYEVHLCRTRFVQAAR
jgi:hypothetical protein